MDLKSIYQWTRAQLEAEAKKRGIEDYRSLTRVQLIGELVAGGLTVGQEAMRLAQSALSAALSSAVIRLPRQLEALRSLSRRLPAAGWQPIDRRRLSARPYNSYAGSRAKSVQAEMTAAAPECDQDRDRESSPTTTVFCEEPIRTRSIARLLAAQGHRERACAIYDKLLEKVPSDHHLRNEAEAVRRGQAAGFENAERIRRACHAEPIVLPDSGDLVQCEGDAESGLAVSWKISEQGRQRAAAVLGRAGELAIRIVAVLPDPERVVRSEVTEYGPVTYSGSWTAQGIPSGARCFTAVGLRANDRFVAIVHAPAQTIGVSTVAARTISTEAIVEEAR